MRLERQDLVVHDDCEYTDDYSGHSYYDHYALGCPEFQELSSSRKNCGVGVSKGNTSQAVVEIVLIELT